LWTTLLLRQISAAFWFTILLPAAIAVITAASGGSESLMLALVGLYSVAGFLWAWRYFLRMQEPAWTGGVIDLPVWPGAKVRPPGALRNRAPIVALVRKELQLHQLSLVGISWLFLLHLGVVWLRKAGQQEMGDALKNGLAVFGGLWLFVPFLGGGLSIAEERKFGTIESSLSLPVLTRTQFRIKLLFLLLLCGLISPLLLWTAEGIGSALGAGPDIEAFKVAFDFHTLAILVLVFSSLSLLSFYASSLANNLLQALAIFIIIVIALGAANAVAIHPPRVFGASAWRGILIYLVACPVLVVMVLRLALSNFSRLAQSWHLWRRNILALVIAFAFISVSVSAVYNRFWELLMPLEPPHGTARLPGPNSVEIKSDGSFTLTALLPNHSLWIDRLTYEQERCLPFLHISLGGRWVSMSENRFVPGTNWMDAAATYIETVAIRSDGTLWVSTRPRKRWTGGNSFLPPPEQPAAMVQFGSETNWLSAAVENYNSVVLLKNDGSLWRWSSELDTGKGEWSSLRSFEPSHIGADSDWVKVIAARRAVYCWKRDGRAWAINPWVRGERNETLRPEGFQRLPQFDHNFWQKVANFRSWQIGLRQDRTLWAWQDFFRQKPGQRNVLTTPLIQIGAENNWVQLGGGWLGFAALKRDGSIWAWKSSEDGWRWDDPSFAAQAPVRLGTHRDWAGIGSLLSSTVSLSEDGTLCYWEEGGASYFEAGRALLRVSRRPSRIENIFQHE
ncbi:MAG TPA: hypothetical protein VG146_22765, partial [Verrucomicrobiae bacterium]|nr:hypothetical protein [Verrucomicrobiae bacterium]